MKTLMVQGTTSDAGKSTLVAGLCRVLVNAGYNVAPFKPQNMALNSAVTKDGGEIGRAQALQAIAAKVEARVDFNPILLKPNSDTGAQVIVHGKAISNMEAGKYHDYKKVAMQAVLESHQRLAIDHDVLLVEGAGSPAEINLRAHDIANMGYAEAVDCPVVLVADIDRGGVFAHLVGTLALLSESEQARVKGFIINRFRGDIKLLESGLDWLEERTGKPVLGVLPYLHDLALDAEDAVALDNKVTEAKVKVFVPLLPHMSNHTDFDPLRLQPNIDLQYIKIGQSLQGADLIILPGSKNVTSDLTFLKQQGWQQEIEQHLRYGGKLLGICGGYQMLGKQIFDPEQIESSVEQVSGLGLLDFTTTLTQNKTLSQVSASMTLNGETCQLTGYEIHCGVSTGPALSHSLLNIHRESTTHNQSIPDGCISDDGKIIATYLHGFFDCPAPTQLVLNWLGIKDLETPVIDINQHREIQLERLAGVCNEYLAMDKIYDIIHQGVDTPKSKLAN
ncbi:cobyric acid synthase [Colwellia sp. PAMC 21821]|uniref:cobyric acid synthase n=1 Tax=Colwellia sp. PAMC 21821 TaxID=1816219 RepID=UPI0009BE9DD1|nr:cobyric acid synthase [Colwellia sp. PAMC 21821]ARD45306.1 cobyric acid synthase CobQ [Colwellia sp. PAMC 21821]